MCGRFSLTQTPEPALRQLGLSLPQDLFQPRYNIAPTQYVLTARVEAGGVPEVAALRWGLVPHWADDPGIGNRMINARLETAAEKPSFRVPFRRRRCLIFTDGFYEWQPQHDGPKQPYRIVHHTGRPFAFAGLWSVWSGDGTEPLETCTILTMDATPALRDIHGRMPVIMDIEGRPERARQWLDGSLQDTDPIHRVLDAPPAERLEPYPVSRAVNDPTNDIPDVIRPLGERSG